MILFREILACIFYITACVGIANMFSEGFSLEVSTVGFLCFALAYLIWPSKKKSQRRDDNAFADIVEFIIELPGEIFLWFFRVVGRLFKHGDGVDLDF